MARLVRISLLVGFLVGYALLAHYTNTAGAETLGTLVALAPLIFAAAAAAWQSRLRRPMLMIFVSGCAALVLCWRELEQHYSTIYWLEHAGTELLLGIVFAQTLRANREPMVTCFARMVHGALTPAVERYTRRVTEAWVCFFCVMAALSTLLYYTAPLTVWSLFANFFTGPLIATMFVAEYLVRRYRFPGMTHAPLLEGVKAYWAHPRQ